MGSHVLVVFTNPTTPEQEAAFNKWYDEVHLAEVLTVPGFVAAQRFKLVHDTMKPMPGPYLALYEMEPDAPVAATDLLTRYANEAKIDISVSMHPTEVAASIFTPLGERIARNA